MTLGLFKADKEDSCNMVWVRLFYCDTLRIQVFLRFSGELVSFQELGQPDLINLL